jgi:protein-tyrosine phosphatase
MARRKRYLRNDLSLWDVPTHWRTCLCAKHDWNWVETSLATGAMPDRREDVDALVEAGITFVVNCATEESRHAETLLGGDPRITYLHNPTPDDNAWKSADWFRRTIDFALPAIENGDRVLVHCHCGSNRGPSAAFAVLLAMGHDPDTAESMVRLARPRARLRYLMDAIAAVA